MKKGKFYKNGLHFECTECGLCCTNPGGYVQCSEDEAQEIAGFLQIPEAQFLEQYVDVGEEGGSFHLKSGENGDCIFLEEDKCSVYPVRPLQCRTYPFWPENLKSAYRWKLTAAECPGINQGRLHSGKEIEDIVCLMKRRR